LSRGIVFLFGSFVARYMVFQTYRQIETISRRTERVMTSPKRSSALSKGTPRIRYSNLRRYCATRRGRPITTVSSFVIIFGKHRHICAVYNNDCPTLHTNTHTHTHTHVSKTNSYMRVHANTGTNRGVWRRERDNVPSFANIIRPYS